MTQSNYEVGPIGYDPDQYTPIDGDQEPVKVIDMEIDGRVYHVPIEFYNENIEKGKTKFATMNGRVIMLTEEEYDMMQEAIKAIKMRRK